MFTSVCVRLCVLGFTLRCMRVDSSASLQSHGRRGFPLNAWNVRVTWLRDANVSKSAWAFIQNKRHVSRQGWAMSLSSSRIINTRRSAFILLFSTPECFLTSQRNDSVILSVAHIKWNYSSGEMPTGASAAWLLSVFIKRLNLSPSRLFLF